jgi:hypothetical protein
MEMKRKFSLFLCGRLRTSSIQCECLLSSGFSTTKGPDGKDSFHFVGHYIFICPEYVLIKTLQGHKDTEFAAAIGHELGHSIDPGKHITFSYVDGKQTEVDYYPVYSNMDRCIEKNYAGEFLGINLAIKKAIEADADLYDIKKMQIYEGS